MFAIKGARPSSHAMITTESSSTPCAALVPGAGGCVPRSLGITLRRGFASLSVGEDCCWPFIDCWSWGMPVWGAEGTETGLGRRLWFFTICCGDINLTSKACADMLIDRPVQEACVCVQGITTPSGTSLRRDHSELRLAILLRSSVACLILASQCSGH